MERALSEGDYVILTSGAIATVRRCYPAGYSGPVEILLDGAEESESSDGLTLPEMDVRATKPDVGPAAKRADDRSGGEVRGHGLRMQD